MQIFVGNTFLYLGSTEVWKDFSHLVEMEAGVHSVALKGLFLFALEGILHGFTNSLM